MDKFHAMTLFTQALSVFCSTVFKTLRLIIKSAVHKYAYLHTYLLNYLYTFPFTFREAPLGVNTEANALNIDKPSSVSLWMSLYLHY